MMITAAPAFAADGLVINGGAAATNNPNVTLALQPPPQGRVRRGRLRRDLPDSHDDPGQVAPQVRVLIPTTGPEERSVRFWVRYRDSGSDVLPGPPLTEAIMFDTLAPRVGAVTFTQKNRCSSARPVARMWVARIGRQRYIEPGGHQVGRRARVRRSSNLSAQHRPSRAGALPARCCFKRPHKPRSRSGPRDALGNVSAPTPVTTPAADPDRTRAITVSLCIGPGLPASDSRTMEAHDTGGLGPLRPQSAPEGTCPDRTVRAFMDLLQGPRPRVELGACRDRAQGFARPGAIGRIPRSGRRGAGPFDRRPVEQGTHVPRQRKLVLHPRRRSWLSVA